MQLNEHPFAFTLGTLVQPTLPALVELAWSQGMDAGSSKIFPMYRSVPYNQRRMSRSVLTHIYAHLVQSAWQWRQDDEIKRRVMVYYYLPTEEMAQGVLARFPKQCTVRHVYDEGVSGIDVRVHVAQLDALAMQVNAELARIFPHNTIAYSKIDGQVNYRIAV